MPDDDDISLSEKRVYEARREATRAYVASGVGVAHFDASDDQIGRFGLDRQCVARDVAGADDRLLVATDEDVLVGSEDGFESTGFGPAVAVGVGEVLLAAGPDGRVARLTDGAWETVGQVDDVRAIDGDLVAAAEGVYQAERADGLDLSHDGLEDVRDVAAAGPLVATDSGLSAGDGDGGWDRVLEGRATVVASDGEHAHAVVDGTLFERVDGTWRDADAPAGTVVGVAYDRGTFAVTDDGRVLLDPETAKDGSPGWRTRSLGLTDVVGVAIP
ncbi:hypothetical protein SAMN05216559_0060 [Halomicrobium zhouii]|uniref:HVO-0234-like beta-propeller domain-containing protein n=1 Tax=Halomicrobium zhouii TaxID=767519 RepID=A0A1I6K2E1_9EURY|nr:hypothetical protein [Halomicrobium zhouii]SFR85258.1 hypothetical protein SAMN05216559_0060 [Halomicrobium zhouii]